MEIPPCLNRADQKFSTFSATLHHLKFLLNRFLLALLLCGESATNCSTYDKFPTKFVSVEKFAALPGE